jgi:hypothetical protein
MMMRKFQRFSLAVIQKPSVCIENPCPFFGQTTSVPH